MPLISTHDFSFAYPESAPILRSVNLTVEEGSFNVLLGANGSGKTTLLQQLHPILAAHGERSGEILWQGKNVSRETTDKHAGGSHGVSRETSRANEHSREGAYGGRAAVDATVGLDVDVRAVQTEYDAGNVAERIGFVMQRPESQVVTDKVWHELAFGLENLGLSGSEIRKRVAEIATYFGIEGWFDKDVGELSGGQRQILNLASAMALNPQLLILDEPTAQLDPISADNFIQMLHRLNYELGITILAAEHELQKILPFATQVLLIDAGEITIADSPERAIPEIMHRYPQMRTAMPVAAQLAMAARGSADTVSQQHLPLTVGEGKAWLREKLSGVDDMETNVDHGLPVAGGALSSELPANLGTVELNMTAEHRKNPESRPAIEAHELWFRYDKGSPDLLRGLNLTVKEGEIFALVGANGSGKSTLISVLSSILSPYRGWVKFDGTKLKNRVPKELFHNYLAVLPQDPQTLFVGKTVAADLLDTQARATSLFGSGKKTATAAMEKVGETITQGAEALGITDLLDRHPYDLSGGEQQLAALLKVILLKPKILLLDEPTKGMDEAAKMRVTELLRGLQHEGVTTLFVTHDVEFAAQTADRAGMFFNGQVASVDEVHPFFSTNNFYTTAASRIGRDWFPEAVTRDEVMECLRHSTNS